jgi:hypothetical protein
MVLKSDEMKKIILMGILLVAAMNVEAQDFKPAIEKTFTAFDTSNDQSVKMEYSNKLALIAKKWDNDWAPHYYLAVSRAMLSFNETDAAKRDAWLDEADKERADAVSLLKKENDETYVLAALIANGRLSVNPSSRWMKYGKVFNDDIQSAKELNPDNPRMYFLEGMSKYHTPKAFGGGKKKALPYFEKAAELFAKEKDDDVTRPYWGRKKNAELVAECKKEE